MSNIMDSMAEPTDLLFVYGTLRRDLNGQLGSYHHYLKNAEYLGRARTRDEYALYAEEYALLVRGHKVSPIIGEVYRLDDPATAKAIDELEEGYEKVAITVILDAGREVSAFVYAAPKPAGELIRSGDYADVLKDREAKGRN